MRFRRRIITGAAVLTRRYEDASVGDLRRGDRFVLDDNDKSQPDLVGVVLIVLSLRRAPRRANKDLMDLVVGGGCSAQPLCLPRYKMIRRLIAD